MLGVPDRMPTSLLLSLPLGLAMTQLALTAAGLTVAVCATAPVTACPVCGQLSSRIHSRYQRTVADLPCAGRRVQLQLQVRKFFCDTSACPRKIFTERLLPFVHPWARMTTRLCQSIEALGLATCGELGVRLGKRLGIQTSPTTILRRVMAVPTPPPGPVSALGIDDFARLARPEVWHDAG